MTILNEFYRSRFNVAPINTLELTSPGLNPIRLCDGFKDRTLTLETGESVTFLASGMDVSIPERSNKGTERLGFAIDNIYGEAQRFIDAAIDAQQSIKVTYRLYLSDDATAPADAPLVFDLVSAELTRRSIQVEAGLFDLLNASFPRRRYTAQFSPGITYL